MNECDDVETCSDQRVERSLDLAELRVPPESHGHQEGASLKASLLGVQRGPCGLGESLPFPGCISPWLCSHSDPVCPRLMVYIRKGRL